MADKLVRGLSNKNNCRVFAVETTGLTEVARVKHGLWPTASAALGRLMAVTLIMGAMNKSKDKITVNINGGGPIGTMMAVTKSDGKVKGFVANPEVHYQYNDTGKLAVGVAVGKEGYLQIIRDMGLKEPFVGNVPLQTGEIGEDFAYYFMVSEQVPSVVSLGVLVNDTNEVLSAGGFIIQLLPEATEENIRYIEEKMRNFPAVSSLIHEGNSPEQILKMIFDDVEILDEMPVSFECDCTREKMEEALISVGQSELEDMIAKDRGAKVTCQFCNNQYEFDEDQLKEILSRSKNV